MKERYGPLLLLGRFAADLALTLLCVKIAEQIRLHVVTGLERREQFVAVQPNVYVLVLALWALFFLLFGAFDPARRTTLVSDLGNLWLSITLAMLSLASLFYLLALEPPAAPSRLFYVYFYVLDMLILTASHWLIDRVLAGLRRHGRHVRQVLLVGGGMRGRHVALRLRGRREQGLVLAGHLAEETDAIPNLPYLGRPEDLERVVSDERIDEVVVAVPADQHADVIRQMDRLADLPVAIRILPDVFELVAMRARIEDFYGLPLISIREPSIGPLQARVKRAFDIVTAAAGLVVLSPILAGVAVAVRLDSPGPVIIHQRRIGAGGRPFYMHKFRSMTWDPQTLDAAFEKRKDDPRVTRVGHALRRTSLDELPQLWNVLVGEMSVVGPRPELPAIVAAYEPWQLKRFTVPPGMTGWWQVNGRADRSMHLNTEIDLYYVQNYSILLDLEILARTLGAVIKGKGAY